MTDLHLDALARLVERRNSAALAARTATEIGDYLAAPMAAAEVRRLDARIRDRRDCMRRHGIDTDTDTMESK